MIETGPFTDLGWKFYSTIMADPPWHFKGGVNSRHAAAKYQTMRIEDIRALPVRDLADENCALFLWSSPPFLQLSLTVMAAWGFRYVSTAFVWIKLRKSHRDALFLDSDMFMSLGLTTRKNSEFCLLGKRGKPKRLSTTVNEVIVSGRREHSRKPDEAYRRAAQLYPGPRLELFARESREGWYSWGNEKEKFDQ